LTSSTAPALRQLTELGQSLWLDNISRPLLDSGTLQRYISEFGITGLTSNPTIFNEAIGGTAAYDRGISEKSAAGLRGEALFVELALEDLRRAADLFRPSFDATDQVDGWVSMEVSPLLANDTAATIASAASIYRLAGRHNLYIKIPGTAAGIPAIEASIFAGIPINVTLLFSDRQYLLVAAAYMRGIERRIAAGLDPRVGSVASLFVSRWDKAANVRLPEQLHNHLGIAMAQRAYRCYCELYASPRWRRLAAAGARSQRLLWASTGSKDPKTSDTLYIEALAAPDTVDTMPEKSLHAFAEHGQVGAPMAADGGDCDATLARLAAAGIDLPQLAVDLQREGAQAFVTSWNELLGRVAAKSAALAGR
jgi:transaldolase